MQTVDAEGQLQGYDITPFDKAIDFVENARRLMPEGNVVTDITFYEVGLESILRTLESVVAGHMSCDPAYMERLSFSAFYCYIKTKELQP